MVVLDLFCGLGGFSAAFRRRGHRVVGVDIVPPAEVVGDVRSLPLKFVPDVILGSPPCDEFSKSYMPWCRKDGYDIEKGMELVRAMLRVVEELSPKWWVLENVAGLRPWMPPASMRVGSRWLWGRFPLFLHEGHHVAHGKWRLPPTADRKRIRSLIPYAISMGLCVAMEAANGGGDG